MSATAEVLRELSAAGIRCELHGDQVTLKGNLRRELVERARSVKPELIGLLRAEFVGGLEVMHQLDPGTLQRAAGEDWPHVCETVERLKAFADMVSIRQTVEAGTVPARFTATAICRWCGPVYVPPAWSGQQINSCPWCLNRHRHKPIPRPPASSRDAA